MVRAASATFAPAADPFFVPTARAKQLVQRLKELKHELLLPVGDARTTAAGEWLVKILGWLVTGLAISLGAPFWFDLLNRLVDLRGAGKRPEPVKAPETTP